MGWASGSALATELWDKIRKDIPKKKRKKIAKYLIETFEWYGCDTMEEAEKLCEDAGCIGWSADTGEWIYE